MKNTILLLIALTFSAATGLALAAPRTATLDVPGMTCTLCPITIKIALKKVNGVSEVDVSYEKKQAVVTFDDAKTSVDALTKATGDAGYPSTVKGGK